MNYFCKNALFPKKKRKSGYCKGKEKQSSVMADDEQPDLQRKSEKAIETLMEKSDSTAIFMSETETLRMHNNLDFELVGMTPRIVRDITATAGFLKSTPHKSF